MPADLLDSEIAALAAALREGRTSARALLAEAAAHHAARDSTLRCYKAWDAALGARQAEAADAAFGAGSDLGVLQGLPVSVKDLYAVGGWPTFAGTPRRLPAAWEVEGPLVGALRAQLAVIPGKTHTVEFAFGGLGTNPHWGAPVNPWDASTHRAPGGSSSGAGVSLWEGSAVLALGTDTAGSVRVPASMTGTVGVKTSFGRWSTAGIVPLSPSLDTAGVLARSAADAALGFAALDPRADGPARGFLDRLSGRDIGGLRIGVGDWFFEDCSPGVAESVRTALGELEARGARLVQLALPELEECGALFRRGGITAPEFACFINTDMADWKATLDPNVAERFQRMEAITAVEYLSRKTTLARLAASAAERLRAVDVLAGPTVPITPPPVAEVADPEDYQRANMAALRNTAPANLLALCAVTLPCGLDAARMPVGLQLIARRGKDEACLAAALACERVLGTPRQRIGTAPLAA